MTDYPNPPEWLKTEDIHLWHNLVNALDEIEHYRSLALDKHVDRACDDELIESVTDNTPPSSTDEPED